MWASWWRWESEEHRNRKICGGGTPAQTEEQRELERTRCELETVKAMYERLLDRMTGTRT